MEPDDVELREEYRIRMRFEGVPGDGSLWGSRGLLEGVNGVGLSFSSCPSVAARVWVDGEVAKAVGGLALKAAITARTGLG